MKPVHPSVFLSRWGEKLNQFYKGIEQIDQFTNAEPGIGFNIAHYRFRAEAAVGDPTSFNVDVFGGALLAICIIQTGKEEIIGSAVMIAPGLAVTAEHLFRDLFEEIQAGRIEIRALGCANSSIMIWRVEGLRGSSSDITFLLLSLRCDIPPNWCIDCVELHVRPPKIDDTVYIAGARFPEWVETEGHQSFAGQFLCSKGKVTKVWMDKRDKVLMPFPSFEIQCGAFGGMSGGCVLSEDGYLIGVISTSIESGDGVPGPTYAAWIGPALVRRPFRILWPPNFYNEETAIFDLPDYLIHIHGRDKFKIIANTSLARTSSIDTE